MNNSPRIPPIPRQEWTEATRDIFAYWEGAPARETGSRSNLINVLANHPPLARRFLDFGKYLLRESSLPDRPREIVTLRIAWLCRTEYEWAHHVRYARKAGISNAELEAIKIGPDAPIWNGLDRATLQAADQLRARDAIDDVTWQALAAELDRTQLMDLVFTIGHYVTLGWAFAALEIELDPDTAPRNFAMD